MSTEIGNSKMEMEGWARRDSVPGRRSGQRGTLRRTTWGVLAVVLAHVSVADAGEGRGLPNFATLVSSTAPLPRDGQKRSWTSLDRSGLSRPGALRGGYCDKTPEASPTVLPSETATAPTPRFSRGGFRPGGNPGANRWFLQSTPIQMLPESGSICGRLT